MCSSLYIYGQNGVLKSMNIKIDLISCYVIFKYENNRSISVLGHLQNSD